MSGVRPKDHIDLVLLHQLGELPELVGLALVVVGDEVDGDLLVELLEHDAAGIVHPLLPQPVLRHAGQLGARSQRARLGDGVAEPQLVGRRA